MMKSTGVFLLLFLPGHLGTEMDILEKSFVILTSL